MPIRDFTSQVEVFAGRSIDNDAPVELRQEFIDLVFHVLEEEGGGRNSRWLYNIMCQSVGITPTGNPASGYKHAIGRDINKIEWPRVYDLICRLWAEVPEDLRADYRTGINRILSGYHVVWDLNEDGKLRRALPPAVQGQVESTFQELSEPRFAPALSLFRDGMVAYDDRPQRGRETCKSIFDALESVSKEVLRRPSGTFGEVLKDVRKRQSMAKETISILDKLYVMANGHFRHGMTTPFTLKTSEVDFVLVSCLAGILLFIRLNRTVEDTE